MDDHYQNSYQFFEERATHPLAENTSLILAAYELKTPENMGAIIRLAANLNVEKVYFIHENFIIKQSKLERVAHSSIEKVDFEIINEESFLKIATQIPVVALETTKKSQNIYRTALPKKTIILCGNERFGLSNKLINICEKSVFIPLPGITRSMNVSHAMTIAAFEWAQQHMPKHMGID